MCPDNITWRNKSCLPALSVHLVKSRKVIVRIKGGLGNQLFCYAAARRLSLVSNAELVIDDVTGFVRDRQYKRRYALDMFSISARKATSWERKEPFERYRRGIAKLIARRQHFNGRRYIDQEGTDFDPRLLTFRPDSSVYIDGLWQSEGYFKDVEGVIRKDLRINAPQDSANRETSEKIRGCNSVGIHVRWYSNPDVSSRNFVQRNYYLRAVSHIIDRIPSPHFFLFSNDPKTSRTMLALPEEMITCIQHNIGDSNAYADLWLMSQCKHFIIADSTFSWWGAWLAKQVSKVVIAPEASLAGNTSWNFPGLIPDRWVIISPEAGECR